MPRISPRGVPSIRARRTFLQRALWPGIVLATVACAGGPTSNEWPEPTGLQGSRGTRTVPETRQEAVRETLHGVEVEDPYRWLEDLGSEETRGWARAQDQATVEAIERNPAYPDLQNRLLEILDFERFSNVSRHGETFFMRRSRGNGTGGVLIVQEGRQGDSRVLVDPEQLFPGEDRALQQIAPDLEGRSVAFGMSRSGSRWTRLLILDVRTGQLYPERLEGLHTAIGQIAWHPDGTGFFYTRWPVPTNAGGQEATYDNGAVYFHRIGTPQSSDRKIIDAPGEPDRWFSAGLTEEGHHLVVSSARARDAGNGIEVLDLRSDRRRVLVGTAEHTFSFLGNRGTRLWFRTDAGAPKGRIVSFDLGRESAEPRETIAEQEETLNQASLVADHFLLGYTRDAVPIVKVFDSAGRFVRDQRLPKTGAIWGGFRGRRTDERALFDLSDLADPGTHYALDPASGKIERLLRPKLAFDPDAFELRQVFYEGKDGTRIPMFLAHHESVRPEEDNPTFLYAYGAFKWSAFPWFQPLMVAFMERGGVYAMANIRGGGEYGEAWHQAGIRRNKQTGVDDLLAAAEWLVAEGYTSRSRLAVNGGSASGLLAAAAMVQRPDLFASAILDIPALDLIRFEKFTGGAYWVPDLGTVDDPEEFRSLLALSPYHNLESGVCYPPTLVTAGERDETTVPSHAYKFIAALQAAQGCDQPALMQVVWGAGHSFGNHAEQTATTSARIVAFLDRHLDLRRSRGPGMEMAGN